MIKRWRSLAIMNRKLNRWWQFHNFTVLLLFLIIGLEAKKTYFKITVVFNKSSL